MSMAAACTRHCQARTQHCCHAAWHAARHAKARRQHGAWCMVHGCSGGVGRMLAHGPAHTLQRLEHHVVEGHLCRHGCLPPRPAAIATATTSAPAWQPRPCVAAARKAGQHGLRHGSDEGLHLQGACASRDSYLMARPWGPGALRTPLLDRSALRWQAAWDGCKRAPPCAKMGCIAPHQLQGQGHACNGGS